MEEVWRRYGRGMKEGRKRGGLPKTDSNSSTMAWDFF
jgi:hypothetical protein